MSTLSSMSNGRKYYFKCGEKTHIVFHIIPYEYMMCCGLIFPIKNINESISIDCNLNDVCHACISLAKRNTTIKVKNYRFYSILESSIDKVDDPYYKPSAFRYYEESSHKILHLVKKKNKYVL